MTMLPFQTIASIASALGHALLDGIWLGAVLACVIAVALRAFQGINAASRHAIWYAALIAIAALPVVGFGWSLSHASAAAVSSAAVSAPSTAGSWQRAATHTSSPLIGKSITHSRASAPSQAHPAGTDRADSTARSTPPARQWPFSTSEVILAIVGAAALISVAGIGGIMVSLIRLLAVKNESRPFDPAIEATLHRWSERPAGGRAVSLRVSQGVDVPAAVGFLHPSILVPASWPANLDADELDKIVMHEYSHLRRADDWTAFVQRLAERIFWFNPAMRYIGGRANLEREIACDDWVVSEYTSATSYAECLWRIAQFAHMPAAKSLVPAALVTRAQIVERIEHLMNSERDIVPRIRPAALAAIVPLAAALLVVGVVRAPAITLAAAPATVPARPATPVHAPVIGARVVPAQAVKPATVKAWPEKTTTSSRAISAIGSSAKIVALSGSGLDVRSLLQACSGCDLSGKNLQNADLHGLRLSGDDMSNVDFRGANLRGTRFEGVNLDGARFDNADLTDAVFAGTDLKHATWSGAKISGIELQGVAIDSAMLRVSQAKRLLNSCQGCDMAGLDMRNLDLSGIHLQGADLSHADLRGANLSGAKLDGVDLGGAQLDGTDLTNASLNGCDLTNVDLRHSHIHGLKLEGADLRKLQFSGLDVRGLTADGADLSGAALQHVDLTQVRMNGADFKDADLTGAQLVNGEFSGADFRNARLDSADLQGAALCGYNTYTDDSGRQIRREIECSDFSGASVRGTNFRGVQLCDWHDGASSCRAISSADLKRYSHSDLSGAVLPSF